jgi:hypothetical protein
MPVYTLQEAETFGVLPVDTIIQVEVADITERPVPGKDGKEGWVKLEFKFRITGVPDALAGEYGSLIDSHLWGSVSAKFTDHPDNKLRQWSESLLGVSVNQPGFELDTDILIGRKARAVISQYQRRDQTFQHQVATLLPAAGVSPTVTAPTVVNTPEPVQQTLAPVTAANGWTEDPPF